MALTKIVTNVITDDAITAAKIADGTIVAADLAANSVDSAAYVDGSIDLAHMSVNSIDSDQYVDGSIDNAHIADDAIDSEHYADGSIDTAHIGALQVTTAKIAADAVTAAKIADDVVNSEHYAAGSIDNEHIADDAIDSEHYAAGSIDTAHIAADQIVASLIADNAIDSEHYTDGSIDNAHIADDQIDSEHYAAASIDNEHLADNAVDTAEIADNAVSLAKMAGLARGKIIYGDSSGNPAALTVGSNAQVLKSDGTDISWGTDSGGAALTGSTNNTVTTVTGANAFQGEANLTFDGSTLAVTGALTASTSGQFATLGVISAKDLGVGLHIKVNDTGGGVHADADAFVIEDTAHSGMTLLTSNSTESRINFGDADANRQGAIGYDHGGDVMNFYSNQSAHTLSMAASEVIINQGGADMDFRVEGDDNDNLFKIDAGAHLVGIGSAPDQGEANASLHIFRSDSGATVNTNGDNLIIEGASTDVGMSFLAHTGGSGNIMFGDSGDNDIGMIGYEHNGDFMRFTAGATEGMRIHNDGHVSIGSTSDGSVEVYMYGTSNVAHLKVYNADPGGQFDKDVIWAAASRNQGNGNYNLFRGDSGDSGGTNRFLVRDGGNVLNTNNSYGQLSDERIKQNIADASSQWDDIKALKVRKFKLKSAVAVDGEVKTPYQIGVVAQEVETAGMNGLVSENRPFKEHVAFSSDFGTIVSGTAENGAVAIKDDDNNITGYEDVFTEGQKVKEVKYSVLYLKAIKCLQEAQTRIETLESKVAVLEG